MCSIKSIENIFIILILFVSDLAFSGWVYSEESKIIKDEDNFIYKTIIDNRSLIYSKTPYEWSQVSMEIPIVLSQDVDVALTALVRSKSDYSLNILAHLALISLDGALGERYTCLVFNEGSRILPYLQKAEMMAKSKKCFLPILDDDNNDYKRKACYTQDEALRNIHLLFNGITKGKKCIQGNEY